MSSFEYEGKNLKKAVQKACDELNIALDEIKYEVLSHGSSGIFGFMGAKKARILVAIPEKAPDTKTPTEIVNQAIELSVEAPAAEDTAFADTDSVDPLLYQFPDKPIDLGSTVLQRIVQAITSDAKVSAEENSERIFFKVTGGNAARLIGKKGQTLEAIQSLVEKIVNKHHNNNGNKIRVQVDVEGYLETRKANLEKLALRLADKSKRIRKPISLGQMSAYDRRIVHMALKNDPDVRTKSRGEGYIRKLLIFPKKSKPQRQQLQ